MKNVFQCCILLLIGMIQAHASIIIPPQHLGEMEANADIVVYGTVFGQAPDSPHLHHFRVMQTLKGNHAVGDEIILEKYGRQIGDLLQDVLGDTDYQIGHNYLLFLSETAQGHYKSSLLALSVFEEAILDDVRVFAHEAAFHEICVVDAESVDFDGLRAAYAFAPLLNHLDKYINCNGNWDNVAAGITSHYSELRHSTDKYTEHLDHTAEKSPCPNVAPSHCTTMVGTPTGTGGQLAAKFVNNNWTIRVPTVAQSDPTNSNNISDLQAAISALDALPGLNVSYGGIDPSASSINCANPYATVAAWAGANINTGYIVFNDPCNNVPNIAGGCGAGLLAVGGGFTSTNATHTDACGKLWKDRLVPYLLINNGIGCKGSYVYTSVIIHELIHGFGIGHTSGSCTALMNAQLCNGNNSSNAPNYGITALDEECTEWMYNAGGTTSSSTISVSPKVYLQAALSGSTMTPHLGQANLIPFKEPYNVDNKTSIISKANMVDWVVVQIRSAINSTTILGEQTGLLRSDGVVVDKDGSSPLSFDLAPGNYYVAIKHRNHLSVMTGTAIALN